MAFSYPVTLNLENRCCTVVGGGEVSLRNVKALLAEGAKVTVISPVLHDELQALYETQNRLLPIIQPHPGNACSRGFSVNLLCCFNISICHINNY